MQAGCSERLVVRQFHAAIQKLPKEILIQPCLTDILQWQVTFMPNSGPFSDRILTFFIIFENFPATVPKVIFQKGVLHPLINPASDTMDSSDRFTEWTSQSSVASLIEWVCEQFVNIPTQHKREWPNSEAASYVKQGTYTRHALLKLPEPPEPSGMEFNRPKKWAAQHERIAKILVAIQ